MVSEESLLEKFLEEKNLYAEYKEWKKEAQKPYMTLCLEFNLKKYKFYFALSPDQFAAFVNWSKTLEDDYPFKALLDSRFNNGELISQTWSDVFLLGKDVKTLFDKLDHDKSHTIKSIKLSSGKVDIDWITWGDGITEDDYPSDYADDNDSGKCARDLIEECQNWDYTENRKNYSSRWNIEDK